jgi:hypothetical protein
LAATARGHIEQLPSGSFRVHERGNRPGHRQAATDQGNLAGLAMKAQPPKERLREPYRQAPAADLGRLAATLAPVAGLEPETALSMLTGFAAEVHGAG